MKNLFLLVLLTGIFITGFTQPSADLAPPAWAKDLIIYEVSTKNYTSPDGPGTGTFNSLKESVPYIADLGITGVWLTGHNWADEDHFYNIWTQYACIRPDSIDPSLGTPADFKALNDAFEEHDIKVFLDIITHGVMNNSPLIKKHPEWFEGGSWGMTDYDWDGDHPGLDAWWVQTHVDYVLKYGVDGYRLDVDIYRPDLWKEIKRQCAEAGHPIVVYLESYHHNDGACDFLQRMTTISEQRKGIDRANPLIDDVPGFFTMKYNHHYLYKAIVNYTDREQTGYSYKDEGDLAVDVIYEPDITVNMEEDEIKKEKNYSHLEIKNIDTAKRITHIEIRDRDNWHNSWQLGSPTDNWTRFKPGEGLDIYVEPFLPEEYLYSIQLSSHDDGWDSFPADDNPYVAEGSRCLFGYSCLFTPAIPLFMSGEEFNAEFVANPELTPGLFGKGKPGEGTWLYGAVIDWQQLEKPAHQAMLKDVKKMISIRKQEKVILHAYQNNVMPNIRALEYSTDADIPEPYILWNDEKAIVVAGNNTTEDVNCEVNIPVDNLFGNEKYHVIDLWNEKTEDITGKELKSFMFTIKKDKVPAGGIAVFKIVPID